MPDIDELPDLSSYAVKAPPRSAPRGREKFTPPNSPWSLSGAEKVKNDFKTQFGKDLPVRNFGQSAFETSVGWNHENAMDVGIHPSSPEGQWLTNYLKTNNIPFNAFPGAVRTATGRTASTGPHIHVGYPSPSLSRVPLGSRVAQSQSDDLPDLSGYQVKSASTVSTPSPNNQVSVPTNQPVDVGTLQPVKLPNTKVTSNINENADFSDETGPVKNYQPLTFTPESPSLMQRAAMGAQAIAGVEQLPEGHPDSWGQQLTAVFQSPGRQPTQDQLADAMLRAIGPQAVEVGRRYKSETGRNILSPEVSQDKILAYYDPASKSYKIPFNPTQKVIRTLNAYAKGGLPEVQKEVAAMETEGRKLVAQQERGRIQSEAAKWANPDLSSAYANAVSPSVRRGVAEASLGSSRLINNLSGLVRDPNATAEDALTLQGAQASIPQETDLAGKVIRGVTSVGLSVPRYIGEGALNPALPALDAYSSNLDRGPIEAATEGEKMALIGGVGHATAGALEGANPIVRQVGARGAAGLANVGLAYAGGERDIGNLAAEGIVGASMPIGKRRGEESVVSDRLTSPIADQMRAKGQEPLRPLAPGEREITFASNDGTMVRGRVRPLTEKEAAYLKGEGFDPADFQALISEKGKKELINSKGLALKEMGFTDADMAGGKSAEELNAALAKREAQIAPEPRLEPSAAPNTPENVTGANTASVPFMITRAMRQALKVRGMSEGEIDKLTPQQANDILNAPAENSLVGDLRVSPEELEAERVRQLQEGIAKTQSEIEKQRAMLARGSKLTSQEGIAQLEAHLADLQSQLTGTPAEPPHHSNYQPRYKRGEKAGQFKKGSPQIPDETGTDVARDEDVSGVGIRPERPLASPEQILPPVAGPPDTAQTVGEKEISPNQGVASPSQVEGKQPAGDKISPMPTDRPELMSGNEEAANGQTTSGRPIIAYHGTRADINEFRPFTHFGTAKAAQQALESVKGRGPARVIPVELDIKNPLEVKDAGGGLYEEPVAWAWEAQEKGILTEAQAREIEKLHEDGYGGGPALIAALREKGFDGIKYINNTEDKGSVSYVAFGPEQVKILPQGESKPSNAPEVAAQQISAPSSQGEVNEPTPGIAGTPDNLNRGAAGGSAGEVAADRGRVSATVGNGIQPGNGESAPVPAGVEVVPKVEPTTRMGQPTGPKVEVTRAEREARGLNPVERQAYQAMGQSYEAGKAEVERGTIDPRVLAEEVARKPRNLSATETGALGYDRARLLNAHDSVMGEIEKAMQAGDQTKAAEGRARLADIEKQLDNNDTALELAGREWSMAGQARQAMIRRDYSLAEMVRRFKVETGKEPTPEQRAKIEEQAKQIKDLQAKVAEHEKSAAERAALEKIKSDAQRESRRAGRRATKEKLDAEWTVLKTDLANALKDARRAQGSGLAALDPEGNVSRAVAKMVRNRFRAGVNSIEGLVDEIHAAIKEYFPDVTRREVREEVAGYGKTSGPSKDELTKQLSELRKQERLALAIEDAEKGQRPARSGFQRPPDSPPVKVLREQLADALEKSGIKVREHVAPKQGPKLSEGKGPTEGPQPNDRLASGNLPIQGPRLSQGGGMIEGPSLSEGRGRREGPIPNDKLVSGSVQGPRLSEGRGRAEGPKVSQGRGPQEGPSMYDKAFGTKNLRKEGPTLRQGVGAKEGPTDWLPGAKKQIQDRINDLQKRIADNDFAPRQKVERTFDSQGLRLKAQLEKVKQDYEVLKYQNTLTRGQRVRNTLTDLANLPRSLKSSVDLSAPRQAAMWLVSHPIEGTKLFFGRQLRAMRQVNFDEYAQQLKSDPDFDLMQRSGLAMATAPKFNAKLQAREEAFLSKIAGRIPGISHSERAYTTFIDSARVSWFKQLKGQAEDAARSQGKTLSADDYKAIAKFVNLGTGRGDLGRGTLNNISPVLNSVFFAPRYAASKIQVFDPRVYARLPEGARKTAVRQAVQYFGTVASVALLLKYGFNQKVGTDPNDSDFGKLVIGNTHYDLTNGQGQYFVLASRLFKNLQNKVSGKRDEFGKGAWDNIQRFLRYKLAPIPSAGVNLWEGKNAVGEKTSVGKEALGLVSPLFLNDLYDAYQQEGGTGLLKASPGFVGVGVQTYQPNQGRGTPRGIRQERAR